MSLSCYRRSYGWSSISNCASSGISMPSSIKPCPRGSNAIYEFYSLVLEVFWSSLQDASINLSSFSFACCCECGCFIRLHTAPGDIDSPLHAILWLGRWSRFGNAQCMFPRASSSGEHWCMLTFLTYLNSSAAPVPSPWLSVPGSRRHTVNSKPLL